MIKSMRMRWSGHVACIMEKRMLVGKPEIKRLLRRPRRKWKNKIKMDFRGIRWGAMDWIYLAQDKNQWTALLNTEMNRQVL
jgi:hypothetical protein